MPFQRSVGPKTRAGSVIAHQAAAAQTTATQTTATQTTATQTTATQTTATQTTATQTTVHPQEPAQMENPAHLAPLPKKSEVAIPKPRNPKLDLSRLEPPKKLEDARFEEITIDGICGVY